jgi:glycosyltransferase involved in cell wall biosynthesis
VKKVIILMSTYNGEKYLREQIDSILAQTYTNIELIVRDDGSSDSTKTILDEYSENGMLSWYAGKNLKPAFSFLDLVRNAPEADYYAFSDQDDVWDIDKIETAVNSLSKVSEDKPALYCSATRLVDAELKVLAPVAHCKNYRFTFGESLVQAVSPGCTFVFNYKTKVLVDDFKSDFISMHDALIYKIVSALGNVIFDKQPHISYRQHGGNVIGTEHSKTRAFYKKVKRFVFSKESNTRYKMACAIEENYANLMDDENLKLLKTFTNYKASLITKYKFTTNKNIKMVRKQDNLFLALLAFMGKI